MEVHTSIPYLREIIVFLISAGVMVPLFHAMRVSPVLGYLMVGGVIGPFGMGLWTETFPFLSYIVIADLQGVQALAELGVIFLMFMVGLELSLDRLWAMRRLVFGLGSFQILVTASIIGLVAWGFGNSAPASIVLGACLALSSTAIVMQLLVQNHRVGTPLGRSSFSILLMQDLAVVPILFVVGVLGAKAGSDVGIELVVALAKAVLTIGLIYLLGSWVLRPALRLVARTRSSEMFMAAILLALIGLAAITGAAGLSMALGAFLAGLLLAETEYRHEVEVDIEPFKGLMLGLFFMSVGMGIDWRVVGQEPIWILISAIGLFALKSVITASLGLAFGLARHIAIETGLLLGQGGEFAFIVVGLAMSLGILAPQVAQFMLIVAGLTMMMTPLIAAAAERLARKMADTKTNRTQEGDLEDVAELEGHVILAGFGRVGRTLANTLQAEGIPFLAIDLDPLCVSQARDDGLPVFFGDASRLEMLNRTHIETAGAVVITMDDHQAAERIIREMRAQSSQTPIFARARDGGHAAQLLAAGATIAIPETIEASLQLAARLLAAFGTGDDVIRRRIEHQRVLESGLMIR